MLLEHGFDTFMNRRLFSVVLESACDLPPRIDMPSGNFACLIAWDARGASVETVSSVVEPLLRAGASYFVCWGPDCERVHDIIDELTYSMGSDIGLPDESCIMTTWHDSEPLREALWFFLVNSFPDGHYLESTRAALAVSIGSREWAKEVAGALDNPHEFVGRGAKSR